MDNKGRQKQTPDDDNIANIQQSKVKNTDSTSRFSRRRFIRSAAITSPILLSVKSPVSWGGGLYDGQCSIVSQLSGNASHPNGCQTSAKPPEYWINTFTGGNDIVKQELNNQGCYASTPFHQLCSHNLATFQMQSRMSKKWQYRISPTSDNPPLLQALNTTGWNLLLEFENIKNRKNVEINILHNVPQFHCCIGSGYLNGLFHPSPVNYVGDSAYVSNAFMEALTRSVNTILWDLQNRNFQGANSSKYSQAMMDLSVKLNTWDTI